MAGITIPAITAAVAEEIPKIFEDAFNRARDGGPSTIRSGEPTSIPGKIGQAAARSACRRYGADPTVFPANRRVQIEAACRPYLDDQDPGNGPEIESPADGGQCAGVPYGARYTWTSSPGANPQNYTPEFGQFLPQGRTLYGPLSFGGLVKGAGGLCGPTSEGYLVNGFFANGTTPQQGLLNRGGTACFFPGSTDTIGAVSFERLTGSGECGDVPPVVRQPRPQPDSMPPPFRFFPGPGGGINVDVDVLPDGTINVNVGGPTFNVDPFSGGGGGDSGGGNDPVGGPGTSGGSGDTGAGGTEEGSADAGEELVGVLVQILAAPTDANRFFNNSELVYRGAYYVAMGYPERLGLDMSGGTAETLQFFHAQQRGLTDYRVRANVGFNLRVTPYYRELES